MAFPLPFVPPVTTGGPHLPTVDDKLVKDKKVRASKLIHDHSGWRGSNALIARGVMGGESGFNPNADNGICCVGLMQMNLNHAGKYGIPAGQEAATKWLKNSVNNIESAYKLWQDQGWDAWEAFTNGSFRKFQGHDPLVPITSTVSGGVVDTVSDAADAALGPLDELASTLLSKDTWFRIGKGALGFNLAMVGVAGLGLIVALRVSKSAPVKSAVAVAKKIPKVPI